MQLKKKLSSSLVVSSISLLASIVLPIIPCRTAPSVPNPIYRWTFCSLNPDNACRLGSIKEFFGYTTSLVDSYFLVLLISFSIAMLFFHYLLPKQKK